MIVLDATAAFMRIATSLAQDTLLIATGRQLTSRSADHLRSIAAGRNVQIAVGPKAASSALGDQLLRCLPQARWQTWDPEILRQDAWSAVAVGTLRDEIGGP